MFEFVENVANYAFEDEYQAIVARFVDGVYYFWGAYYTVADANQAADQIGGTVFTK